MVTLSLCMIVKNEERVLAECLNSVKDIADEIIIVDTGSTDNTKAIASKYTDKIYDFEWIDDFAAARNFSFSKAAKDFILWLDADDIILEEDRAALKLLKLDLTLQFDTVIMKYILKRDDEGREINYCYRERILKREKNFIWRDPIHEYINFTEGVILHTEIAVTHTKVENCGDRNLKILRRLISDKEEVHPRHYFYYAHESYEVGEIEEARKYYLKFLDMPNDSFSHYIESCIILASIYMQQNERRKALKMLVRSFEYGPMRAEVLCLIGTYYRELKDYLTAIAWYEMALALTKPVITWQSVLPEYWDFIPWLELCHCYYMVGDISKAIEFHQKAKKQKPHHPAVAQNEQFFEEVLKKVN